MKIAAIDVGSNATRLTIHEIKKNGRSKKLFNLREPLRLGADVFSKGKITPKLMQQGIGVFKRFKKILKDQDVSFVKAVGTSALRDSINGDDFVVKVRKQTGISIEVIDGQKEAELVISAVKSEIDLHNVNTVLIDIGGGSTELSFFNNGKILKSISLNIGTLRIIQNSSKETYKSFAFKSIEKSLKNIAAEIKNLGINFAVGTGGNVECLGKLRTQILQKQIPYLINQEELHLIQNKLEKLPISQMMQKYDLKRDRADVLLPGSYIVDALLSKLEIGIMLIPFVGVKDGIVLDSIKQIKL